LILVASPALAQTYTGGQPPSFPGGILNPPGGVGNPVPGGVGTPVPGGVATPVPGGVATPVPAVVSSPIPAGVNLVPGSVSNAVPQPAQVLTAQVSRPVAVAGSQARAGGLALTGFDVVALTLVAIPLIVLGAVMTRRARPKASLQA
jgi:hypothetical protein